MNADLSDPRWLYIWPAYGLSGAALSWLVARIWLRLRKAERAWRARQ